MDEKELAQEALQEAYPSTPEGMADLLHVQLYFGHAPAYIYKLRQGINMIVDDDEEIVEVEKVDDITDGMIETVVKNTAMQSIVPETNIYDRISRKADFYILLKEIIKARYCTPVTVQFKILFHISVATSEKLLNNIIRL